MRPGLAAVPLLTEGKRSSSGTARLDTVGVALGVHPDFELVGGTVTIQNARLVGQETISVRHQLPGGGFVALGKGDKAWVEASAKRAQDGSNIEALPVAEALESMREAVREASAFCDYREGARFDNANVVRLDPVRDFDGVEHVGELLDGLAGVSRDSRWKSRRWADTERNRAESLRVGPKSWGETLYDKWAETRGEAPPGRVRSEGRFHSEQLRSEWAKDGGFRMPWVSDVTEEKVAALCRAGFDRVGYSREVVGKASLASKIFAENGLTRYRQGQLWAFLTAPGFADGLPRTQRFEYRKLARELGVALSAEGVEELARPVLVRLDFESGREICRVA